MRNGIMLAATLGLLQGCGGGTNTGPANINLAVSAGPSSDYSHVWITVTGLAYTQMASEVYSPTDTNWINVSLPQPLTIDLTALDNGTLNNLFSNLNLPSANYGQVRLFVAGVDSSQALQPSAAMLSDGNGKPLQWNNQIEYISAGTKYEAPLEVSVPQLGLFNDTLEGLGSGANYTYVLSFNLDHSIVPFVQPNVPGGLGFTMGSQIALNVLQNSGAIQGQLDTTKLCQPGGTTTGCASHVVAMAELEHIDSNGHVAYFSVENTAVDPVTGRFDLFPLNSSAYAGNYEVVIRGQNMQTLLIDNVPVAADASPSTLMIGNTLGGNLPTALSTSVLPVNITNSYTAQAAASLSTVSPVGSGAGYFAFMQTSTIFYIPMEIQWSPTDPYTGLLTVPSTLQNSNLHEGFYNYNTAPSWYADAAPSEGSGAYSVFSSGWNDNTTGLATIINSSTAASFTPPAPMPMPNLLDATVTAKFSVTNTSGYDRGQLVFMGLMGIANSVDISGLLGGTGGSSTCQRSTMTCTATLLAGNGTLLAPGAVYYAYLRLWHSNSSAFPTLLEEDSKGNAYYPVNLSNGGSKLTLSVTIP
ncbi:MAG: DUF4382 domain-containing protein [Pseudomonadales bacterium]|nr:DUF4382 domain-containing protein [Pseudomonadales bacterium]